MEHDVVELPHDLLVVVQPRAVAQLEAQLVVDQPGVDGVDVPPVQHEDRILRRRLVRAAGPHLAG